MFLIAIMSIIKDPNAFSGMTEEQIMALPNWEYVVPCLICAVLVFIFVFAGLILMFRKISLWSKNGEKEQALN